MNCPVCGAQIGDPGDSCSHCGIGLSDTAQSTAENPITRGVKTHLATAIVMTLFFLPCGVVAIFYAVKARTLLAAGKFDEAVTQANKAERWCWIAFALGVLLQISIWSQRWD
jgi:interferon-induced transmembrane protein